ncbi:MAG TPA: hypothetical protein PLF13_12740 [candidate division Zixibacteria bacterium]|nr:hypothetical protein [candidate division Zixibacteria bacterium]
MKSHSYIIIVALTVCLGLGGSVAAQMRLPIDPGLKSGPSMLSVSPAYCLAAHRVGKIELAVANNGTFGVEYHHGSKVDCFTGQEIAASCQYPKNSNVVYLFGGAFWIGAVVGRDTLVSVGADGWQLAYEMYPDEAPFGEMIYRSIKDPESPRYVDAVSEEDYIAVYTDTLTDGVPADFFGRPHQPLYVEVTQSSYAWSYSYAEDFVLFDYKIRNIGVERLREVYMGVYVDCMVCYDCMGTSSGYTDDHSGFLHTYPAKRGTCEYLDTVSIAWIADNDGDLTRVFDDGSMHPCPNVTATRIVRTPAESLDVSFNWWIGNGNAALDFGPRERAGVGRRKDAWRDFRTGGLGTPEGDGNKYYQLSNREFDYNQVFTASIQPNDTLWMYPDQDQAADFADGYDARYLLSFGPFEIEPGQTLPISFAYVAGENLHTIPDNAERFLPQAPESYLANLDFSDLATNAQWASWIYDNPGVDSDGDGDSGSLRICCDSSLGEGPVCDTFWYEGDGIPDFRGAAPPPAPKFWVERPEAGVLRVRFNGFNSETTRDVFSGEMDFEGYRIYMARDVRATSYSVVASYDREDYNKFVYVASENAYQLLEHPFTIDELRCLYGESCYDSTFDPLSYRISRPYVHPNFPESLFYFTPQDYNVSEPGITTDIVKVYAKIDEPTVDNPAQADSNELTDDGYFKYYEYEFYIRDYLPTVPYLINVTAFDYGSPESGLASLETSVTDGAVSVMPYASYDSVVSQGLEVYVYPNPYRSDGDYRSRGFEGRVATDRPSDRTREIHFANLPPRCTIRIFSLDGDLVRQIDHDVSVGEGHDTHAVWNLITRNTQLAVSGLYYWTVEAENGETQIGKLVLIM